MSKTVISITTIPSRMHRIGPTLASLLEQDAQIDAVILWIPEKYRRPEFSDFEVPVLASGVELRRCKTDYGPATKVLPALLAFRGQDVQILYCDDDRIYHSNWASGLLEASERFPGECIAQAGEVVAVTARKAFGASLTYQFYAKVTLGIFGHYHRKAIRALEPDDGVIDICKGYGGVLVRPEYFTNAALDIPDLLWTVDDVWLSGQMALNGVTIRKPGRVENSSKTDLAQVGALVDYVYQGQRRENANMACIRYFRETYGIWME